MSLRSKPWGLILLMGAAAAPVQAQADLADLSRRAHSIWLEMHVGDRPRAGVPTGPPEIGCDAQESTGARGAAILRDLDRLPLSAAGSDEELTRGVIREAAELAVGAAPHCGLQFSIAPNQASFHFLQYVEELGHQPVSDEQGRAAYLAIVGYYGALAHLHLDRLRGQEIRGRLMSRYLVDRSLKLLRSLRGSLREDLGLQRAVAAAPAEDRDAFASALESKLKTQIEPAFDSLIAYLAGSYASRAPQEPGLAQYPGGRDYYRYLIRRNSSLPWSAQQIHDLGRRRVAEIGDAIVEQGQALGMKGDARAILASLRADRRYQARSIADWQREYAQDLRLIEERLPQLFSILPSAGYRLEPMRESESGIAYGYYVAPTPNDPQGVFRFGASGRGGPSLLITRALAYHEVLPGHHLQFARVGERRDLDPLRSIYWVGGYTEGWAEYAVSVAAEQGLFDEPHERLGYLAWQLLMAARLVADTGINDLGWTVAEAESYWRTHTDLAPVEVDTQIQRSAAIPGQLLAYRLGYEKLREWRETAERERGEAFDLKAFHEILVAGGALPLGVLESRVRRYIDGKRD